LEPPHGLARGYPLYLFAFPQKIIGIVLLVDLSLGLMTALSASFLFALLIYIFVTIFDSSVIELYTNEMKAGLEETKFMFSDEMYDKAMEGFEKLTIVTIAYNDFFIKMVGALLVTFVTAAIYRKVPSPFEE
jgi:hypothetical protein